MGSPESGHCKESHKRPGERNRPCQEKQRDESETARENNLEGGRKEETQVRDTGQMTEEKDKKKEEGGEDETVSVKELIGRIEKQ